MPQMDGITVLSHLKSISPDVPVVILTAHGDVPTAVRAIKEGAYDFMLKPVEMERLALTLERAIEKNELVREVKRLNSAVEASLESVLGRSEPIKQVIRQIRQVTQSDFSILVQGETGTGKSFLAKLIHRLSRRAEHPFVVVDMGVIPESLVESELFGYERGAFTGADRSRKGFFELASKGTILVDELENMSAFVQAKLLSVVEQKQIRPVGGSKEIPVDLRIIGATNTDLLQAVKEKRFREDLYFRLNEFSITVPPLRHRVEDIPLLAQSFLSDAGTELNKQAKELSDEVLQILTRHSWPGNIRELKNVIRRALLFSDDGVIRPQDLELYSVHEPQENIFLSVRPLKEITGLVVREAERKAILNALTSTGGNKSRAASLLQIDYKTMLTKVKDYNIRLEYEPSYESEASLNYR
jgi:DNA-binding NtrC family response regulator